jgi:hypothetical protein
LRYLYDKCKEKRAYGYIEELEMAIGKEGVRGLEIMGYIRNGFNEEGDTWKVTERGRERAELMFKPSTWWERFVSWFYV